MKSFNLLFTYITPFHPEKGGIGRVTDTLTREFLKRGHKVYYLIYESAITERLDFDYPAPLDYFPSKELLSEENVVYYRDFLRKNDIDYVINQSGNFDDTRLYAQIGECKSKLISVLHSEPLVAYRCLWHEIIPLRNSTLKERFKQVARVILYPLIKRNYLRAREECLRYTVKYSDKVCMLSSEHAADLYTICGDCDYKYVTIPNPNSFANHEKEKILAVEKKPVLLYVGALVKNKRVDRLIRAWRKLFSMYSDWEVVLIGDGNSEYVKYLKCLARGIPRISFKGCTCPELYYQSASILVHPTNYEGWPMVVTEAMQYGVVPVLFNSFATAKDIVKHEISGMLVTPYDSDELQQTLSMLMKDGNRLMKMSKQAMICVEQYNVEHVADIWESLFGELVAGKSNIEGHSRHEK